MTPPIELDRRQLADSSSTRHLLAPPRSLPPDPASVLRSWSGSARSSSTRSRSPVATTTWCWPPGSTATGAPGPTRCCTARATCTRPTTRASRSCPTAELPWYRITWDESRREHDGAAFDDHAPLVAELLERIRRDGPLSSTDIEPRAAIDWYWRPTNQVRAILEALAEAGILGLARREGNRRVYDLAERLFPADAARRAGRPSETSSGTSCCHAIEPTASSGASGSAELWSGIGPVRGSADRPAGRAEASSLPSWSRTAPSSR